MQYSSFKNGGDDCGKGDDTFSPSTRCLHGKGDTPLWGLTYERGIPSLFAEVAKVSEWEARALFVTRWCTMASFQKCAMQLDVSTTFKGKDSPLCQQNRSCASRLSYRCRYCQSHLLMQIIESVTTSIVVRRDLKMAMTWMIFNATLASMIKSSVI